MTRWQAILLVGNCPVCVLAKLTLAIVAVHAYTFGLCCGAPSQSACICSFDRLTPYHPVPGPSTVMATSKELLDSFYDARQINLYGVPPLTFLLAMVIGVKTLIRRVLFQA